MTVTSDRRVVLERLRQATRAQHGRAEELLDVRGRCLASGAAGYAAVLGILYGVHSSLEELLDHAMSAGDPIGDWAQRRGKPDWLASDLDHLCAGAAVPFPDIRRPDSVPALVNRDAVLGCLYVVEGSTLGGPTARRQIRSVLGNDVPVRFFTGYAAATAANWRTFCAAVAGRAGGASVADMIAAARATFDVFRRQCAVTGLADTNR